MDEECSCHLPAGGHSFDSPKHQKHLLICMCGKTWESQQARPTVCKLVWKELHRLRLDSRRLDWVIKNSDGTINRKSIDSEIEEARCQRKAAKA